MTIPEGQTEDGDDALAREAAHWFARQRSPDADASRAAFEAWLAQGPEHLAAYNDAAEVFAMGKLLSEPDTPAPAPSPPARRLRVRATALAMIAACAVGVGSWIATHPPVPAPGGHDALAAATEHRRLATVAGPAQVVRLADGSIVRLGAGTILEVDIGSGERRLALLQGQARFEVAHEGRPFIVRAGGGSVTARGTIFDVALVRTGSVEVRLLQGAVDVAMPRPTSAAPPALRKLKAGEGVSFTAQPEVAPPAPQTSTTAMPPPGARDVEAVPVATLVAEANRGAARPILLADATLGARRVSGRFQLDDPELLARRLGALFGTSVDASDPHAIVLAPANKGVDGSRRD